MKNKFKKIYNMKIFLKIMLELLKMKSENITKVDKILKKLLNYYYTTITHQK